MTIGEQIKQARMAKGLTQKQLGELSETSEGTVRQYEIGKRQPRIEQLQRIASALGIPVGQLLPLSADQEPDREYERVHDALDEAGFVLEAAGWGDGSGPDGDIYYVWHKDAESPEEDRAKYSFRDLLEVIAKVNQDADARRRDYFRKRLDAELFFSPSTGPAKPTQSVPASPEGSDTTPGPEGSEPPDSREE